MAVDNNQALPPRLHDQSADITKLAVLAVGGQGGAVLSNWIITLANAGGFDTQMTSVAGVAQRTGATIYYIEMAPKSDKPPVFALSPSVNDIDIVIAAEMMEAGRAVLRGFVSPDKTTLIASSHRVLATTEKIVPGDGRADSDLVLQRLHDASLKCLCYDLEKIATDCGSVISASLFGALYASQALPFNKALYEQSIRASSRGVEASLTAFHRSIEYADLHGTEKQFSLPTKTTSAPPIFNATGPKHLLQQWQSLNVEIEKLPVKTQTMVSAGVRKTFDYQDADYARDYLNRVKQFLALDSEETDYRLTIAAAKYLANALCYDDLLRVADLKTRHHRTKRIRHEQQSGIDEIVQTTEFFHPRAEEFITTLPRKLGRWISQRDRIVKSIDFVINRGRRIRSDSIFGFTLLWLVAGLRPMRKRLLRHEIEMRRIDDWIARVIELCTHNKLSANHGYAMAEEYLKCQRLIKGYSNTHAHGISTFAQATALTQELSDRTDGPEWLRRLREAALADTDNKAINEVIAALNEAKTSS